VGSLRGEEKISMRTQMIGARDMMVAALELLDTSEAPLEIGAHLDLAICQLNEFIDSLSETSAADQRNVK
jgi:hypothetical protein